MLSFPLRFSPMKSLFEKLLLIAITFPHVTFGLVPAETSPFPLLFSFFLIYFNDNYEKNFIYLNLLLLFLWVITIPQGLNYLEGIQQLFVYLQNIFVAFYIFRNGLQTITAKFCIILISFHLISGVVWIFGLTFLNDLLVFLSGERLGSEITRGQGSRFFSTEPSEAMGSIFFILLFYSLNKFRYNNFVVFITIFLTAILSSSGTSLMLLGIFLVSLLIFFLKWFKSLILLIISFVLFQSLSPLLENLELNNRIFILLQTLSSLELSEIFSFISLTSGWRFTLDFASYISIFFLQPMYGIGTAGVNSLYSLTAIGIDLLYFSDFLYSDIQSLKPSSLFACIFLELGLFGLFLVIYFFKKFYKYLSILFTNHFTYQEKGIFCIALFKLFFLMIVGTPASLASLFLAFHFIKENNHLGKVK